MSSRKGRTPRRKHPLPILPHADQEEVKIICPSCWAEFAFKSIGGDYLHRLCPHCATELSYEAYDKKAKEVIEQIHSADHQYKKLKQVTDKRKAMIENKPKVVSSLLSFLFKKKLEKDRIQIKQHKRAKSKPRKQLSQLSTSRYYTSEWYFNTRQPIERTGNNPYKLDHQYLFTGEWTLKAVDHVTAGMTAEYRVFDALLEKVQDPNSPLFQARLLPNIFLPKWLEEPRRGSAWSQIDLILITKFGAFVIEVKSRNRKKIIANAPFTSISIGKKGEAKSKLCDGQAILAQNSIHAVAFDEHCDIIPFERIYEQIVFVRPSSFTTDFIGFSDNVNVSVCKKSQTDFILVIENECLKLDPILAQEEIDTFADDFILRFGDLNQKRGVLHTNMIKNCQQS